MIIDTDHIENLISIFIFSIVVITGGLFKYLKYKGYWDIWKTKLRITFPIAAEVDKQDNDKVMEKLMISDEALNEFKKFASDKEGKIDSDKLLSVLHDYGRIRQLVILNSRLNQKQKDEVCDLLYNIIQNYNIRR